MKQMILIIVCAAATSMHMQASFSTGALDTTLNPIGVFPGVPGVETIISLTKYFGANTSSANSVDIARQADGKLVAVGTANPTAAGGTTFAVVRINGSDGSLDTTFNPVGTFPGAPGVESLALVQTFSTGTSIAGGDSIAIQSNGQIILFGDALNVTAGATRGAAIVRLNTNGTLDATWNPIGAFPGNPGAEILPNATFGAGTTGFSAPPERTVAIQPNGQIIFVGSANPIAAGGTSWTIGRLNATNGSLDISWNPNPPATFPGSPGVETLPLVATFGAGASSATPNGVVIQSDGQILVAGTAVIGVTHDLAIGRLNASNGSLDTTWNTAGMLVVPAASIGATRIDANSIALQPDGKPVVAGTTIIGGIFQAFVARFNTNGSLDTTFNSNGTHPGFQIISISTTDTEANSIAVQADGSIVTAGGALIGGQFQAFAARLLPSGSLDPSFNSSGILVLPNQDFGGNVTSAFSAALLIQPNGKVVLTGHANPDLGTGSEQSFSFVRLAGASTTVNCLAAAIVSKYCPA